MKILIVANSIVGGITGGESRFIELAKIWQSQGHEIHLMSSTEGVRLCEEHGLKVIPHILTNDKMVGRLAFVLRTLKLPFKMGCIASFTEGMIYSANEQIYDVLPALWLKLRHPSIRWATVVHWLPPLLFWKRKASTLLNSFLFLVSERVSVYLAGLFGDVLLPVGESTYKALYRTFVPKSKIHSVICGVNFDQIQWHLSLEKKYDAIFMKRIQASKGIFDIIDIWAEVIKKRDCSRLLILGKGIDLEEAKHRVREYGLSANVDFKECIHDDKEKYKILSEAKLMVHPSYEENWSLVIGEAMAAGLPVIAYDLADIHDIWKDNCIWCRVGDKRDFANKIVRLLKNEKECKSIGNVCRDYVKQFDWNKIAKEELRCLGSL